MNKYVLSGKIREYVVIERIRCMTGEYRIYVKSKSVVYDFSIRRKITVIVGDSGSGKTRFVSLLKLSKMRSKVRLECDADVVAVEAYSLCINYLTLRKKIKRMVF